MAHTLPYEVIISRARKKLSGYVSINDPTTYLQSNQNAERRGM